MGKKHNIGVMRVTQNMLHTTQGTLYVTCYMLHVTCYMFHTQGPLVLPSDIHASLEHQSVLLGSGAIYV